MHLLCDALGRPLRLRLTPGQASEIKSAAGLLEGVYAKRLLADKAYDANWLRAWLAAADMEAVIPAKRHRKVVIPRDTILYRERNRIERCFNKLKHFRRVATRYDRCDTYFLALLHLACTLLWLR